MIVTRVRSRNGQVERISNTQRFLKNRNKKILILILRDVTFFSIIQKKRKNGALLFVWHDFRANIEI